MVEVLVRVLWLAETEVSVDEGEMVLVAMVAKGIVPVVFLSVSRLL